MAFLGRSKDQHSNQTVSLALTNVLMRNMKTTKTTKTRNVMILTMMIFSTCFWK